MQDNLAATLRTTFGFDSFRSGQAEAIASLLQGQHTLVVMPTGAGKSLVYQLCALHRPGVTLVVSPLIALMKDQVDSLTRRGIPAAYINSTVPGDEQTARLQELASGALRLVYVAPERLRSMPFRRALSRATLGLLAVDEAHCISQWGHDFRPEYLHIASVRTEIGNPLTAALTATATPQVQDDIVARLGLPTAQRIVTGFNRPNLSFEVRYVADDKSKLHAIQALLHGLTGGAAIIYAGTRRTTEETADFVHSLGHEVRFYHAGMDSAARTLVQESFIAGDLPVVVATNAFGMGIDRPDVRMVIHNDMPGTLEAYYQEAGRAGRDGDPARAVLLYSPRDRALQEYFIENDAPSVDDLRRLHNAVHSAQGDWMSRDELSVATGLPETKIRVGLAQLESSGALEHLGDDGLRMLLRHGPWNDKAAQATTVEVDQRRRLRHRQLAAMVAYAESNACRRRLILDHFGDRGPDDAVVCCDNCQAKATATAQTSPDSVASMSQAERAALIILDAVRRMEWEAGRKKLAQMLAGSQAKDMHTAGYDKKTYYGRLSVFRVAEIEDMISQVLSLGYLKQVGGNLPVLRLTPQGQAALKARASIPLHMPRPMQQQAITAKKAEREAGGTYALTAQMLAEGLTPAQIAARRLLSEDTIYNHLARFIAAGTVRLEQVVRGDVAERVRAAIGQSGSAERLAPLKMALPSSISYGEIRCVVEAWNKQHGISSPSSTTVGAADRVQRIASLGDTGKQEHTSELIEALNDPDGNVRRVAASALGKIGARQAVAPLVALLGAETKPQVRQYAVKALGRIGDQAARPVLQGIASNDTEMEYTRTSARTALRQLAGRMSSGDNDGDDAASGEMPPDAVDAFLARPHPRLLAGPWSAGWALGFHSGFGGADWKRSDVGELTNRLKYEGDATAIQPLVMQAAALCRQQPALDEVDALTPVPPTKARSLDPVSAFAQALATALGKPLLPALRKTRQTAPQKDFQTLAQKRTNVAGAFAVTGDVRGKRLLVLDDLFDSGATLNEVTRVLIQAGAASVSVLTMTRTIHSDR